MATTLPSPGGMHVQEEKRSTFFQEALDGLLEFTGATAGWIGLVDPAGSLSFPARSGTFPESWLTLQQGQAKVWGFEVREGPVLLNDLPALPALGEPPLRNLLSCSLMPGPEKGSDPLLVGHIVLANKAQGFLSHDSTALQMTAHLVSRHLLLSPPSTGLAPPASLLRVGLDRTHEGILVVDQAGRLLFANAAWSRWTGYPAEELIGRVAPFPFWVSHRDLATLGGLVPALPQYLDFAGLMSSSVTSPGHRRLSYLPFRHRNHSLFWCQVETLREEINGQPVTLAFLRQLPGAMPSAAEFSGAAFSFQALAENLPFAVALTDGRGQVLWTNQALARDWGSAAAVQGQAVHKLFAPTSGPALERLIRDTRATGPQGRGQLLLQRVDREQRTPKLVTYWQSVALPEGPGFLFAFAEDWEEIGNPGGTAGFETQILRETAFLNQDSLALLLRPGAPVEFWDERWERLTGMRYQDLAGEPGELVLDWLFPQQRDREFVADLFHRPTRRGAQAVLEVGGRNGGRMVLCTFLPIQIGSEGSGAWLILASESRLPDTEDSTVQRFLRQFTRGLAHLLNNYLTLPIGLAEMALDRSDLPADLASSFSQILESCMRTGRLVAALQDLAADAPGDKQQISLASLVREFAEEQAAEVSEPDYELALVARDADALVEVNPRMLKVVLQHLLANAVEALSQQERRQIHIQVYAGETDVRCEIRDTGAGLPVVDWTAVLAPFYSTKGSFAQEAGQSAVDALGLGLTVSQHLLSLHGGRLELQSVRGEGTTVVLILPRVRRAPAPQSPHRSDISAKSQILSPKS